MKNIVQLSILLAIVCTLLCQIQFNSKVIKLEQQQQRAYLFCRHRDTIDIDLKRIRFKYELVNIGNTPAYNVLSLSIFDQQKQLPQDSVLRLMEKTDTQGHTIAPGFPLSLKTDWFSSPVDSLRNYLHIYFSYKDIYDIEYFMETNYELLLDSEGFIIYPIQ